MVGKWVYLVEGAGDQRQEVEVIICEDVDKPCDNDSDSPHGEGTTVCKQLFRTQKMLAIDNDNEVVVDTFELPSACVCNYRREELGLRNLPSTQVDDDTFRNLECGKSQVTAPLSTRYVRYDDEKQIEQKMALLKSGRNLFERKESDDLPEPKPCKQGNLTDDSNVRFGELCIDSSESGYPESLVKSAIRKHNTLRSPVHFKKLFDRPCEYERPTTAFRVGLSFQESPLCTGYQSYIFPKIAKTVKGEWKYIINTDEYRQGVTVEVCHFPVKGNVSFVVRRSRCLNAYFQTNRADMVEQRATFRKPQFANRSTRGTTCWLLPPRPHFNTRHSRSHLLAFVT